MCENCDRLMHYAADLENALRRIEILTAPPGCDFGDAYVRRIALDALRECDHQRHDHGGGGVPAAAPPAPEARHADTP